MYSTCLSKAKSTLLPALPYFQHYFHVRSPQNLAKSSTLNPHLPSFRYTLLSICGVTFLLRIPPGFLALLQFPSHCSADMKHISLRWKMTEKVEMIMLRATTACLPIHHGLLVFAQLFVFIVVVVLLLVASRRAPRTCGHRHRRRAAIEQGKMRHQCGSGSRSGAGV